MPSFAYTARDAGGTPRRGVLEAVDSAGLVGELRSRGWVVLEVRAATAGAGLGSWNPLAYLPPRSLHVEVTLHQIAVMLRSGLTLLSAIKTVIRQSPRRAMARVWQRVAERVQEGSNLHDAMAEHGCFGRLVLQLVKVGEQTGQLDRVLADAAATLEARRLLRTGLITAMIYPAIVVVMAVGVTSFMVGYAVPKISGFLRSMGRPLPAMTQWLVDFSAWVNAWLAWIVGGSLLAGALGAAVYVWRPGRLAVDRWTLRLPVLGGLLRLGATAAFSHALAILLRSGVTLLEALGTAEQLHHNRYLGVRLAAARDQVLRGGTLADALEPGHAYTPMLASMVAVGEASGSLDDILDEVARFHGSQLQSAIRRFSAIIEPVIIVVVGSIVGFVYVAFFLALFAGAGGVR